VRTIFLGTSEYAVAVLDRLATSEFRPALVVTPPDRRRGRGRRVSPPPTAAAAQALDLDLLQVESVNAPEALERIRAAEPEVGVVAAFGQLVREPLLSELELLNVHPSLLPRWRGAAPIARAIMAGDTETGVTIMRVTEGLDSGPVALQRKVAISDDENNGTLAERLAAVGGDLAVDALDLRRAGELSLTEQDDSLVTYADKIEASERRLDPERSAVEVANVVRALTPQVGAYVELERGERLGVTTAAAEEGRLEPGTLEAAEGRLRLGCADGVLRLDEVQPAGKRPMPADAYLRGHPVPRLP
jgi:methionyl-tRNA formyltransferase